MRGLGEKPDPILLQAEGVIQTSAQVWAHLLCSECEQLLHHRGEDTFFRLCYRAPGKFKLLSSIKAKTPALKNDKNKWVAYTINEPLLTKQFEEIAYFGTSIFWKSAVHHWHDPTGLISPIQLGSYAEQIRNFLLGRESFPEYAALVIEISEETNRLIQSFGVPGTAKFPTHHAHQVHICGIQFNLVVGKRMPRLLKGLCAFTALPKIALVSKDQELDIVKSYRHIFASFH